jgi:parallel beta-helix repeat protein
VNNGIDVSAPGVSVLSTYRNGVTFSDANYEYLSGTSMATPHVSGIASLLKGYNSNLANDDIEHLIQLSADKVRTDLYTYDSKGWNTNVGYGRVNARKALDFLRSPYALDQATASGGTDYGPSAPYWISIYGAQNLSDGYYLVKRHIVQKTVSFSARLTTYVWGRGTSTTGWTDNGGVNYGMGWCDAVDGTVNSASATLRTYVYEVWDEGGSSKGWYPTTPANVSYAYTVLGVHSIINVPADYSTIEAALANAISGQTVYVGSGTVNVSSNLTVQNGVTLELGASAHLVFTQGTSLTVASTGRLLVEGTSWGNEVRLMAAEGVTWGGVVIDHNNTSQISFCSIEGADSPLTAYSVTTLPISYLSVTNSDFGGDAALRFYGSSPALDNIYISGGTYSWNGIRFAEGSSGSLTNSWVQSCGAGNGIVIQGNSHPLISGNWIQGNHYHGIVIVSNGSASPQITGNYITENGRVNDVPIYTGVDLYNSVALFQDNNIYGSNYGIYCETYSSPTSGQSEGSRGHNHIYDNNYGIIAYYGSNPAFGRTDGEGIYVGTCNTISSNVYDNVMANVSSTMCAQVDYWGAVPPDASKIHSYNNSYVYYSFWQTDQFVCPGGGEEGIAGSQAVTLQKMANSSDYFLQAMNAALKRDYNAAESIYKLIITDSANEGDRRKALIGLYDLYRMLGKHSMIDLVASYANEDGEVGITASELIYGILAAEGKYSESRQIAVDLATKHSGTEIEKHALIHLVSLGGFAENERVAAASSRNDLVSKFGKTMDEGLLVALSGASLGSRKASQQGSITTAEVGLSNYPNPFNPVTTITYHITRAGKVNLKVFDVLGREIATLVNTEKAEGSYTEKFDASRLSSGVYFYQLIAPGVNETRKMLIAK